MNVREALLVELVDDTGAAIGSTTVDAAHTSPGQLHRAFSVILVDPDDRILLQQRAATKTRFAGRWANACCGHPGPGVPVAEAAVQRLGEELGSPPVHLTELGVYAYRAADLATGRVEHEFDHVLIGAVATDHALDPDPAEVSDVRWITRRDLLRALSSDPDAFAPWLAGVVALLP
jgi:isopentenyl-diphosphate delta-isomerase